MKRKRKGKSSVRARLGDRLVVARKGEVVDLLVSIDRSGADYAAGAAARKAGQPREQQRSLNWVLGWDEAAQG